MQGALIRSEFGVGEVQRVVADDGLELFAFQGQIKRAL